MKKILIIILLFAFYRSDAQITFNPQAGMTFQRLTSGKFTPNGFNTPVTADFTANLGLQFGLDLRFGKRVYFQPGAYYVRNVTTTKFKGDTLNFFGSFEDEIERKSVKLKSLIGVNLVNADAFKLRLNAGPTYDFLLLAKSKDGNIEIRKSDFNNGSFNIDAGLGIDISFLTFEFGYSYGISRAFDKNENYNLDSKFATVYLNAGIVF